MPRRPPQLPSAPTKREKHKAASAQRMLAAARKLFLRHGFEDVSMRQIAKAARCTPGALYVHFQDKRQLLIAMMDQDFTLFASSMQACESIADPVLRLRESGRAYVRFALEHPHHYRMMFMTPTPAIAPSESTIQHGNPNEDGYCMLRQTVADCIKQERFLPKYRDVELVTQSCWSCAHGFVSLYITHSEDEWVNFGEPLRVAYACLDMHIEGLTGHQLPELST
jgi:AcrR family transcriptional regulator